jgi:hypothetical protein
MAWETSRRSVPSDWHKRRHCPHGVGGTPNGQECKRDSYSASDPVEAETIPRAVV